MDYRDINRDPNEPNLGAVVLLAKSETRAVCIKEPWRRDPCPKFPGGGIKATDAGIGEAKIVNAAIREGEEEAGLDLDPRRVRVCLEQETTGPSYVPYLCVADMREDELDRVKPLIKDERGRPVEVHVVTLDELRSMPDLHPKHRKLLERYDAVTT